MSLKSILQDNLMSRVDELAAQGQSMFPNNPSVDPKVTNIKELLRTEYQSGTVRDDILDLLSKLFSVILESNIQEDGTVLPPVSMFVSDSDGDVLFFDVDERQGYLANGRSCGDLEFDRPATADEIKEFISIASKEALLAASNGLEREDEDEDR